MRIRTPSSTLHLWLMLRSRVARQTHYMHETKGPSSTFAHRISGSRRASDIRQNKFASSSARTGSYFLERPLHECQHHARWKRSVRMHVSTFTPEGYDHNVGIVLSASVPPRAFSRCNRPLRTCSPPRKGRLSTGKEGQQRPRQPDQLLHRSVSTRAPAALSNLLDGIGNGVQGVQAANTGITSRCSQARRHRRRSVATRRCRPRSATRPRVQRLHDDLERFAATTCVDYEGPAPRPRQQRALYRRGRWRDYGGERPNKLGGVLGHLSRARTMQRRHRVPRLTLQPTGPPRRRHRLQRQTRRSFANGDTLSVNGKTITFASKQLRPQRLFPAGSGLVGHLHHGRQRQLDGLSGGGGGGGRRLATS